MLSIFYFNKKDILDTSKIEDFDITNRVLQGTVVNYHKNKKSIDIRIPVLDNRTSECVLQMGYADCIIYLQAPGNRRSTDQQILSDRDMKRTEIAKIGIWQILYGSEFVL